MFYTSVSSSVLTSGLSSWGGNISRWDKETIDKIIRNAGCAGRTQVTITTAYWHAAGRTNDAQTEWHNERRNTSTETRFDDRRIQRSGKLRVPRARTARHQFVCSSGCDPLQWTCEDLGCSYARCVMWCFSVRGQRRNFPAEGSNKDLMYYYGGIHGTHVCAYHKRCRRVNILWLA